MRRNKNTIHEHFVGYAILLHIAAYFQRILLLFNELWHRIKKTTTTTTEATPENELIEFTYSQRAAAQTLQTHSDYKTYSKWHITKHIRANEMKIIH